MIVFLRTSKDFAWIYFEKANWIPSNLWVTSFFLLKISKVLLNVAVQIKARQKYERPSCNDAVIDIISEIDSTNSLAIEGLLAESGLTSIERLDNYTKMMRRRKISLTLARTGISQKFNPQNKQVDLLFFEIWWSAIESVQGIHRGAGIEIAKLAFYINALNDNPSIMRKLAVASMCMTSVYLFAVEGGNKETL